MPDSKPFIWYAGGYKPQPEITPLSKERFQALRAAVDFSYYIEVGLITDTVNESLVSYYEKLSKSENYYEWLQRQVWIWHLAAVGAAVMLAQIEEASK